MATKTPSPPKQPQWPSLEAQLADSHVEPGSALSRLIEENQDFHLLPAREAGDRSHLPPWLRVYWRKRHPDTTFYPRALSRLYDWMLHHQDLPLGSTASPVPSPFERRGA